MSIQPGNRMRGRALAVVLATGLSWPGLSPAWAATVQAASAPTPGSRVSGTVTAIAGNVLTVKDDKGTESKVAVADSARVLQLPAGAKSLSAATPIKVSDIAIGDRILAKTTPDGNNYTASTVVAMKQADVAKAQQSELQDWKTKGVNGIVKSVDPAAQTVTISTGNGPTAKTTVIQASKTTNIRRYAPDSIKFDNAKPATLDQINPGDQLRAKGNKNEDGTQLTADAIVAGTFRNIAGTVISVDAPANKVVVDDLATKKPFTIDVSADSQLHKLSPMMAQGIAMRLKGGGADAGAGAAPGVGPGGAAGAGQVPGASGAQPPAAGSAPGQRGGGDVQQMLNRAPALALVDLKKGDAIMALTTEGRAPGEATAVILLAGVEPLLQASPRASQSVLSASWNLGGGAAAGQDAQ
jgi:ribosomal protein L24